MGDLEVIREKLRWMIDNEYEGFDVWEAVVGLEDISFMGSDIDDNERTMAFLDKPDFQPHLHEQFDYLMSRGVTSDQYNAYVDAKQSNDDENDCLNLKPIKKYPITKKPTF